MKTTNDYYVASYERVSTEEQTHTRSCEDQKIMNDRYIAQQGWQLIEHGDYRDEGLSGKSIDRPGLQDLIIRCQEDSRIKAVVVTEADRIARGNVAFLFIRESLKKAGVKIVAVTQPMIDDTDEGEMLGEIMGAVNGYLASITRRKSMRALDMKAERGWYPSKAPLFYLNFNAGTDENPNRIIIVDEVRKHYALQIPKLYNRGYSYAEISDMLFDQGLRGNEKGKVSPEEIR